MSHELGRSTHQSRTENNLDAYRGTYPARTPRLTIFQLKNVDTVTVTGPLTVEVGTVVPWVAFPATISSLELPDDGGKPFTGLAAGHPLVGMWRDAG